MSFADESRFALRNSSRLASSASSTVMASSSFLALQSLARAWPCSNDATRTEARWLLDASSATFDKLDDGTFAGTIPSRQGVVALGETLAECQQSLRSTLEDWLLLGLRMGHAIPVLTGPDLNGELAGEPLDAV